MKTTVMKPVEIEVSHVGVNLPVRFDDEDISFDFPLRDGDTWVAVIEIDTGRIQDWPEGRAAFMHMKVTDEGNYLLMSPDQEVVAGIYEDYVPHGLIPGEYGDYVILDIGEDGVIKNWPSNPSVADFFPREND